MGKEGGGRRRGERGRKREDFRAGKSKDVNDKGFYKCELRSDKKMFVLTIIESKTIIEKDDY